MFGNLGFTEVLVIGALVMLLFGGRKIPEFAKGLGEGLRIFKKELAAGTESPKTEDKVKGQTPGAQEKV